MSTPSARRRCCGTPLSTGGARWLGAHRARRRRQLVDRPKPFSPDRARRRPRSGASLPPRDLAGGDVDLVGEPLRALGTARRRGSRRRPMRRPRARGRVTGAPSPRPIVLARFRMRSVSCVEHDRRLVLEHVLAHAVADPVGRRPGPDLRMSRRFCRIERRRRCARSPSARSGAATEPGRVGRRPGAFVVLRPPSYTKSEQDSPSR